MKKEELLKRLEMYSDDSDIVFYLYDKNRGEFLEWGYTDSLSYKDTQVALILNKKEDRELLDNYMEKRINDINK